MLADARQLGVRADHVLAHVLRVRARVADALDPLDLRRAARSRRAKVGFWPARRRQVAPVGVDVLPQQRHLLDAVGRHRRDLLDQLPQRPADLAPARRGHDAVGAAAVAADADLQPALEGTRAARRQVAGEALELEVALRGERVAREELGELVDLAGPEGDVHEREALEHLLLDRLRPAAADAHDALGLFALQPLGLAEMGDEAAVGRLADRAGVEEDQVRRPRAPAPRRSRATRASPSCARSRARSSGSRTWSGGSASSRGKGTGARAALAANRRLQPRSGPPSPAAHGIRGVASSM